MSQDHFNFTQKSSRLFRLTRDTVFGYLVSLKASIHTFSYTIVASIHHMPASNVYHLGPTLARLALRLLPPNMLAFGLVGVSTVATSSGGIS